MFDLGKQKIEVQCNCGRQHFAKFNDAVKGKIIRCSCGADIQLKDGNGSVRRGVNDFNKAFKDLENTLKKLGAR